MKVPIAPDHSVWRVAAQISRFLDLTCIGAAHYLAQMSREYVLQRGPAIQYETLLAMLLFCLIADLVGLYGPKSVVSWGSGSSTALLTWSFTAVCVVAIGLFAGGSQGYSRIVLLTWFVLCPALMSTTRLCVQFVLRVHRTRTYGAS